MPQGPQRGEDGRLGWELQRWLCLMMWQDVVVVVACDDGGGVKTGWTGRNCCWMVVVGVEVWRVRNPDFDSYQRRWFHPCLAHRV